MEQNDTTCAAIEQLYSLYHQPILRHLQRLVAHRQAAEDLCQDTFLKALRSWEQHNTSASVSAWLYRIATNTAYDYLRRQRRIGFVSITSDMFACGDAPLPERRWEEAEPILVALDQLPKLYRTLLLYIWAGYEVKEIADALGSKHATVRTRVHRARLRFKRAYAA